MQPSKEINMKGARMIAYPLPTGYLFVDEYEKGLLETLSIGDYGKAVNVQAKFLGHLQDIDGVPNTFCMPLSEKWVVTVSTQYGCPMKCNFCDVPNVTFKGNLFPSVKYTDRLNLHFARMGDPIFNADVFNFARWLYECKRDIQNETGVRIEVLHPVLTTSLPRKFSLLEERINEWVDIKNRVYNGQAGLQFSINSTDDAQRDIMFAGQSLSLTDFSRIAGTLPHPLGRKYCLNFAYSTDYIVDGEKLASLFDSEKFMCKITPIHNNNSCRKNGIHTESGYESYAPYRKPQDSLEKAGFDVLVFIPSLDEEKGLVTCGNAILGGSVLRNSESVIKIRGLNGGTQ
jgi:23S rRNA (adenine2503-C2)-methyltransferase